ncbi:MAG: hypothetical protein IK141_00940 [Clostridia bacterium]|nr:hypothetical protein [Clostridia bacterium]
MKVLKTLRYASTGLLILLFIPFSVEVFGALRPAVIRPLGIAMLVCLAVNVFCAVCVLSNDKNSK